MTFQTLYKNSGINAGGVVSPFMPTGKVLPDIMDLGPVVEARIFPDERTFLTLSETPKALPRTPKLRMLVDTGSNISSLHVDIIHRLQLPSYSESVVVEGAGGPTTLSRFKCVLHLPVFGKKGLPIDILEGSFETSPYQGVIGRDVLRYCKLTYDGLSNRFRLTAPGF